MQSQIKVIVFDLEDVIINSWHNMTNWLQEFESVPHEEIKKIFDKTIKEANVEFNYGRITEDEFWERFLTLTKVKVENKRLKETARFVMTEIAGIRNLIKQLKDKYKTALLTNFPKEWFDHLKRKLFLSEMFDYFYCSGYSGFRKPEPGAYQQILNHFQVKAEECLFIDDKERNLDGAKKIGMTVLKFRTVPDFKKDIKNLLGFIFKTPENVFRSTDIRGVYNSDIDYDFAVKIGKTFGTYISKNGEKLRVCVGRDYRNGGGDLLNGLINGLRSVGIDVVDIGIVPTPVLYSTVINKGFDGGVIITGSHNPPEWNGFKIVTKGGELITGAHGMEDIKKIFYSQDFVDSKRFGSLENANASKDYFDFVSSKVDIEKKFKIVIDPGNGTCHIVKELFESLGCEVHEINNIPDGNFPSRASDPIEINIKKLKEETKIVGADLGIAFDGDGDRIGFVDNRGRYTGNGNTTIAIFTNYILEKSKGNVVVDICTSTATEEYIKANGGNPIINKVGHGFITERMVKENALFGGEFSNHIYFPENNNFDDAIFAAAKMLELLSKKKETLAEIVDKIPKYDRTLIEEIPVPDSIKFEVIEKMKSRVKDNTQFVKLIDIDGLKIYNEHGWVLIRASNTMPQIKVNAESKIDGKAIELQKFGINLVEEEIANYAK